MDEGAQGNGNSDREEVAGTGILPQAVIEPAAIEYGQTDHRKYRGQEAIGMKILVRNGAVKTEPQRQQQCCADEKGIHGRQRHRPAEVTAGFPLVDSFHNPF